MTDRVAIIHPWLPQYRRKFFEELVRAGAEAGLDFEIFYGATPAEWSARGDAVTSSDASMLPTRRFGPLNYKSVASVLQQEWSLIIVEQAVRNLETYELFARARPVAFWGHGRTYTKAPSLAQERFKRWLTRRGRWFFAYTPGGAAAVISSGFDEDRVTIVQNSIDTSGLSFDLANVNTRDVRQFKEIHGLSDSTAIYIGGLDRDKRLGFLFEAAQIVHERDPMFRLLIAGNGSERDAVRNKADKLPYVHYLGPLFGEAKAVAMKSARVLAMPGRVGLVAVDSFVAGLPMVTTDWPWHAPEFEYLRHGQNSWVTRDSVEDFANGLHQILGDELLRNSLEAGCHVDARRYTLDAMVRNFLDGTRKALVEAP